MKFTQFVFLALMQIASSLFVVQTVQAQSSDYVLELSSQYGEGVWLLFDTEGGFEMLVSTYKQPVNSDSKSEMRKARTIARENAKAAILKFLQNYVSSDTYSETINVEIEQFIEMSSGDDAVVEMDIASDVTTSLTNIVQSNAAGNLRGIETISEVYDETFGEVLVTVAISERSIAASKRIKSLIGD